MFCPKCGTKALDGAIFCQKCGAKLMADEAVSQTTATPQHEPIASVLTIMEDTQQATSNNATKVNGGLHKIANIGRVLMGISLLLLLLCSFFSLPINPIIIVGGIAIGTILSALGLKRPFGMTKIIELVVACILLVAAIAYAVSSSGGGAGGGDKYVQMVKGGTLDGYPQKTVGEAFDDFLHNPKWESSLSEDGERFVNVKGGAVYADKEVELVVQFLVDEAAEIFNYNACEINGVPQNNLIFWNLLETIYNVDSALPASATQNNSNPVSDKIVIGNTQSYDNEYGNMEVTLDYVEFTDRIENSLGGYNFPDEGSIFLRAAFTLKNIGTDKGSLITAWSTAVFDGMYEYRNSFIEGETADINPLTSPATGALIFMVPNDVAESDKSLVININDGSGQAVISYVIRPVANTSGESGSESVAANEILYKGIPVSSFFDTQAVDVAYTLGFPTGADRDDDIRLYIIPEKVEVESAEVWNTSALTVDGVTLNKNRDGLIEIFGQLFEEGNGGGGYFMSYNLSDCSMYFELGEPTSEAWRVSISPSATNDSASSEILYNGEPISARDFVGAYSYDASFETPDGQYTNFYYLLEIGEDGEDLVVTETWRGNDILDHVRVSPENLTGNTLVVKTNIEVYDKESYSLTYIPAKDSPLGKDTIYIDGDETMPFVRE